MVFAFWDALFFASFTLFIAFIYFLDCLYLYLQQMIIKLSIILHKELESHDCLFYPTLQKNIFILSQAQPTFLLLWLPTFIIFFHHLNYIIQLLYYNLGVINGAYLLVKKR